MAASSRRPRRKNARTSPKCAFYPDATSAEVAADEKLLCEGQRVMFRSELEFGRAYVAPGDEADVYGIRTDDDDGLEAIIFRLDDGTIAKLSDEWVLDDLSEHIVEVMRQTPAPTSTDITKDLAFINEYRRRMSERPLDPQAAGWTAEDVVAEARRLRSAQGNPRGNMARTRKKRRKKNPLSTAATVAILGAAAVAAGAGGYYAYRRWGAKGSKIQLPPAQALEDIIVLGSTIGDAPWVASDIMQPIMLSATEPPSKEYDRAPSIIVARPGQPLFEVKGLASFGSTGPNTITIVEPNGTTLEWGTDTRAINSLVTGLSPEMTRIAYELALLHIVDKGVEWNGGTQRDAAIKDILNKIAPDVDWSQGLSPYTYGSEPWLVWTAVELLGTVANQSYFNKQA